MAIAQVQKASASNAADSVTATFGSTPTQNNLLIAVAGAPITDETAITITGWTVAVGRSDGANTPAIRLFYKVAGAAESTSVTATATGSIITQLHIFEYSGCATASPLDQTASASSGAGTPTSLTSGTTGTTAQADELLIAAVGHHNTNGGGVAWTTSFTAQGETNRLIAADKIVSATGTYETTGSWTTARRAKGVIATFKAAGGGASVTGTAAGSGTGAGTASGTRSVAGVTAGSGTGSGTVTGVRSVTGAAAASGTGTGSATATRQIVGVLTGSGAGSGTATATRTVFATATASGLATAVATATRTVLGVLVGTGTGTGALIVEAAVQNARSVSTVSSRATSASTAVQRG